MAAKPEKRVKMRLFKDSGRYSGDVTVGVNGVFYKIKRGEEVEVPASVAEVLEHSDKQTQYTAAVIEKAQREYSALASELN